MNQITEAFMKVGVPVPSVMERMWTIIKEEGPTTAWQMRKRLPNIPPGTIGSKLFDLESRGMVYSRGTKSQTKIGKGSVKEYLTDLDKYELLPLPAAKRVPTKRVAIQEPSKAPVATQATPTPQTQPTAPSAPTVEHLTIAQARELYAVLHKMFGGK